MGIFKLGKDQAKPFKDVLLTSTQDQSYKESFYKLCYNIMHCNIDSENDCKVIMLNAPKRRQGVTTVSINLAQALGEMGQRVLLLEGNLRYPILEALFRTDTDGTLNDILEKKSTLKECILSLETLPFDMIVSKAESLNTVFGFSDLKVSLSNLDYDWILIDTPSTNEYADASLIADLADAVLLVVRKLDVERQETKQLMYHYRQSNVNVIGSVLTFDNNL